MLLSSIEDKISSCYTDGFDQFTDFLSLEEADEVFRILKDTGLEIRFYGGYTEAERRMLGMSLSDEPSEFPISILCGEWDKFGEISHRDILGSIMALGIERRCIGDILVDSDQRKFYVFAVKRMTDYLQNNVDRIGRCSVQWHVVDDPKILPECLCEEKRIPVSSLRVDVIIAAVWRLSRQMAGDFIASRAVFVNHRAVTKCMQLLKPGDSVVLRGRGKFIFLEENGLSKKGKTYILVKQYL